MLTQEIATEIVKQTTIRLKRNINIMDDKGFIIASGNPNRINQAHFGAMEVLRTGKPLVITEQDLHQWEGALPGINLPIEFQKTIIGVIGITGDPDEIREFGELVKMITEMMIQQSFITEQLEWKQRLKELVFEDLLKDSINHESIQQRLNLIGIELEPPFQVAVMEIGLNQLKKSELIQVFEDVFDEKHTLIGFLNLNRLFILSSKLSETRVKQKLLTILNQLKARGFVMRIGIGSAVETHSHICHSFEESRSALTFGDSEQSLITYTEVETKALLDRLDKRTKQQFSKRALGNLSEKLIETLEQFFISNLNIGECAKRMYIHLNSLIYRIKKIKELTGYNPQQLNDAITLQLAVWINQMHKKEE